MKAEADPQRSPDMRTSSRILDMITSGEAGPEALKVYLRAAISQHSRRARNGIGADRERNENLAEDRRLTLKYPSRQRDLCELMSAGQATSAEKALSRGDRMLARFHEQASLRWLAVIEEVYPDMKAEQKKRMRAIG